MNLYDAANISKTSTDLLTARSTCWMTGNPFELNRYVTTANDPANLTDPSGLTSLGKYAAIGFTVVLGVVLGIAVYRAVT